MEMIGLYGSLGTTVFFAFLAFAVWLDYRKKKDEGDALHQERMKALELGHPPPRCGNRTGQRLHQRGLGGGGSSGCWCRSRWRR